MKYIWISIYRLSHIVRLILGQILLKLMLKVCEKRII